jgi:hypothetical protein
MYSIVVNGPDLSGRKCLARSLISHFSGSFILVNLRPFLYNSKGRKFADFFSEFEKMISGMIPSRFIAIMIDDIDELSSDNQVDRSAREKQAVLSYFFR